MSEESASIILQTCAIAAGLIFAYFFGLIVNALENYSSSKIEELVKGMDEAAKQRVQYLDKRWLNIQTTAVFGRLSALGLMYSSCMFTHAQLDGWSLVAKVAVLTVIVFIVGYAIPRAVARRDEESIFLKYAGTLNLLSFPLWPLVAFSMELDKFVGKMTGSLPEGSEQLTEEVILDIVSDGEYEGVIEEQEAEMIENIISFNDVPVSEVMTVRSDLTLVSVDMPLGEAARISDEAGHSRIPVYEGDKDNVVGVLYVKDLLKFWSDEESRQKPVSDIMRKAFFVPESKSIAQLFGEFKIQHVHFAVVLDEYGGTTGVVTIEDILEEIVGDIEDEYDPVRIPEIQKLDDNVYIVQGKVGIKEFNETTDLNLPESDKYETIGGMVLSRLGRIPEAGEECTVDNFRLTVEESDARTIKLLKLDVIPPDLDEPEENGYRDD